MDRNSRNKDPAITKTTGSTRSQAIKILRTVSACKFFIPLLATMLPAIPEESTFQPKMPFIDYQDIVL